MPSDHSTTAPAHAPAGPTAFDRLIGPQGRPPCAAAVLLGWRLLEVDPAAGTIVVRFEPRAEFANPVGNVQGGFLAAMLDETLGPALLTQLAADAFAPTLELKVNFIRPAPIGPLTARARVVSAGRTVLFVEGALYDADERLVATASATSLRVGAPREPDRSGPA